MTRGLTRSTLVATLFTYTKFLRSPPPSYTNPCATASDHTHRNVKYASDHHRRDNPPLGNDDSCSARSPLPVTSPHTRRTIEPDYGYSNLRTTSPITNGALTSSTTPSLGTRGHKCPHDLWPMHRRPPTWPGAS